MYAFGIGCWWLVACLHRRGKLYRVLDFELAASVLVLGCDFAGGSGGLNDFHESKTPAPRPGWCLHAAGRYCL